MIKKLTLLAMAVGALVAFAAPAMAQAEVLLTNAEEEPAKVGDIVTVESNNTVTTNDLGTATVLSCASVHIEGELTENTPHVTLEKLKVKTSTPCNFTGNPIAHISASIKKITLTTGGTGTAYGVQFTSELTGLGLTCHFTGNGGGVEQTIPITWAAKSISIPNATNLNGKAEPCPLGARLHGTFPLTNNTLD